MGGAERADIQSLPADTNRRGMGVEWRRDQGTRQRFCRRRKKSDVNVEIVARKGVKVSGRATSSGVRCELTANGYGAWGLSSTAAADGTMTWDNVQPARYRMNCTVLVADGYIVAARQGDRDVLKDGLVVSDNEETNAVSITLGNTGGIAEGTVLDSKGGKAAGVTVVLIPDEPLRDAKHLYRATTTDQSGGFSIRAIAPGLYHAYVWPELEGAAYKNAAFMKSQTQEGTSLKIDRSSKVTLKLTLPQ